VDFDHVHFVGDAAVQSGERLRLRVEGRISVPIPSNVDALRIRVRSLRTGTGLYITGSRQQGTPLTEVGPFSIEVDLQANLPPGSYLVEIMAQDLLTMKEISSAPPIGFRVMDATTFGGSVQLNGTFTRVD
jgi:hypothetical protein